MRKQIVYKVKKKLGCIFVESILLKSSDPTQNVTERSNDMETFIGGTSVGNVEKAGQRADSVQSIENRKFYESEEEFSL